MQKNNQGDKKACRYYSVRKVLSGGRADGRIYADRRTDIAKAEKHGVRRVSSPEYGMFFRIAGAKRSNPAFP